MEPSEDLLEEVTKRRLPERTALALLEAAAPVRVRNASYRVSADISNNLASRDLNALTDAGLLKAAGEKRGRHYVAGDVVMAIRNKHRLQKGIDDPFQDPQLIEKQLALL